jgi:hypothetical protein
VCQLLAPPGAIKNALDQREITERGASLRLSGAPQDRTAVFPSSALKEGGHSQHTSLLCSTGDEFG